MCGIVGIVHRSGQPPVEATAIQRMCDAIRHRGPDDEGLFVAGGTGLGMRRLSIIDLAGGHQPIFNEDRTSAIVFNGEIYNYRDLRRAVVARGHDVRTNSDTETILHLYEDEGWHGVEQLRGMFAFAIWDATRRTLTLARDRFGIKPLYVVETTWGLAFASELKALVAVGLAGGDLDLAALDAFLQLGYMPAPATPFRAVRKLAPGHVLQWRDDGHIETHAYWDLPRTTRAVPADLDEQVLAWLDDSVAAHLVSDVPVAAFLSGGLDSSAIVSSMAIQGVTPHAFTVRYHGTAAGATDETPLAQALATRYGARLTVIDVHPQVRDLLEPIVRALDEPQADESAVPSWLMCQAVAGSFKVALTGTGGDELFAGYRRHLGLLLDGVAGRAPALLRRTASALVNAVPEPRGGGLSLDRMKRFLRTAGASVPARYAGYVSRLPDEERTQLYAAALRDLVPVGAAEQRFAAAFRDGGSPTGVRAALYLDYKTYLPDDILMLADRMSMAHSLELRVPFVDHRFVEEAYPLPDRQRVGLGRSKRLLRRALRARLPQAHFSAPKRGFVGPTAAWLRKELRDVLCDELSAARMTRLGFFDPATVQGLLDDHFERRHNREGILWALLCFSTWHRLFVETPSARPYQPGR